MNVDRFLDQTFYSMGIGSTIKITVEMLLIVFLFILKNDNVVVGDLRFEWSRDKVTIMNQFYYLVKKIQS